MRRFVTVLGAGLSALLSAAAVAAPTEAPSPASAATSAVIESRVVPRTWAADATVEAVRQATLAAQVAGRVLEATPSGARYIGCVGTGTSWPADSTCRGRFTLMLRSAMLGYESSIVVSRLSISGLRMRAW